MSEIAPLAPDPADKVGDDFGGTAATGHRSGYGPLETRLERILRFAKKGATLAAGEGALICQYYEEQLAKRQATYNAALIGYGEQVIRVHYAPYVSNWKLTQKDVAEEVMREIITLAERKLQQTLLRERAV